MYFSVRSRAACLTALCGIALPALLARPRVAAAQTHAAAATPAPPRAKLSTKQAEAFALKKVPGKVKSSVYELEDGHWQYAVIVTSKKGQMVEVAIDPTTGKVLSAEKTSASEEAKEAIADKKKAVSAGAAATPKKVGGEKEKDDEKDEKDEKGGK